MIDTTEVAKNAYNSMQINAESFSNETDESE
jgi:hypothetical protein